MSKKTARSRSYWQKRFLQEKDNQLTNAAEYESAMRARLKEVEQVLEQEVDYWLKRYANNQEISHEDARKILSTIGTRDWHMTLKEFKRKAKEGGFDKELDAEYFKSQLSRLENIDEQLANLLSQYATAESDKLAQSLSNQFQKTYMHSIYLTQLEQAKLSSNFANINEYQVKVIVNKPWNGSNFSKRIWKNYTEVLPNELGDALLRGTVLGHSHQQVFKMMRQRLRDVEDYQLHRLVITEMGHIAEEATAQAYKEECVEKYQYLATLESHTCEECGHLDGKIFDLKDKKDGVNYPLIHPYCRCTTMPYIEGLPDSSERWARNPETGKGEYVENMTFDEWKDYVNEEREIQLSQGKYGANLKYVRSDDFKSKVSLDYHTAAISDSIVNVSKRILQHRNGTPFEDYYLLDKKNGKIQAVSNQTHKIKGVNYNNSVRNAFKNGNKNQYISIHNHPSGYPPSLSDIAALSQVSKNSTVAMGLTIGHDCSMYWYTPSAKKFKKNDDLNYDIRLKKNLHMSYNEVVAQEATLAEFADKYGFKFGKIGD